MRRFSLRSQPIVGTAFALAAPLLCAAPVSAASSVTYVSGKGTDSGTCPSPTPCRTFAYAIGQTSAGGQIIAMTSGDYQPVTVTKAISLVGAPGVEAAIKVPSAGVGVTVNAGANDVVSVRNLSIDGGAVGYDGILFNSGGTLEVIGCTLRHFAQSSSFGPSGDGINMQPNGGTVNFLVSNTTASDNAYLGFVIRPVGGAVVGNGIIDHSVFTGNEFGFAINARLTTGGTINVTISNSVASNNIRTSNDGYGIYQQQGGGTLNMTIDQSEISGNSFVGIEVSSGTVQLSRSVVTKNGYGIFGNAYSYGDNSIDQNATDVNGNLTTTPTK